MKHSTLDITTQLATYCILHSDVCTQPRLQTILYSPIQKLHYTALYSTALHCTALRCTALHSTTLHYKVLHFSALPYTALHITKLQ